MNIPSPIITGPPGSPVEKIVGFAAICGLIGGPLGAVYGYITKDYGIDRRTNTMYWGCQGFLLGTLLPISLPAYVIAIVHKKKLLSPDEYIDYWLDHTK
uniref:Transmembrane protein n=1 Tax=Marseillevirus LCMAC201 TaxID=2506605 RepID=A0A481YX30_9VIRU|nr:MAG: hypothetical protein LCMAC201_03510 [Marseillevirus LCMAC201]